MSHFLFESPTLGIILAVVAEFILLLAWIFARQRVKIRNLLIGPALVVLVVLGDFLVETDREAMDRITREVVLAVEQENAAGVISHLGEDFGRGSKIDKARASAVISQRLSKPIISKNNITELLVNSAVELRGQVQFRVTSTFDPKSVYAAYGPFVRSKWQFDFQQDIDGQWQIVNIKNLGINEGPAIDVFSGRRLP